MWGSAVLRVKKDRFKCFVCGWGAGWGFLTSEVCVVVPCSGKAYFQFYNKRTSLWTTENKTHRSLIHVVVTTMTTAFLFLGSWVAFCED